jgi:carbon-monoxide dehydrogenase large subunit
MMDELAVELGRDPLDVRKQNWITHEEFPFTTVSGLQYDSGNYEAATDKATEMFDYDGLRAEQARRRESGDPVQLGIGISTFTEMCGLAPSRVWGASGYVGGGWEVASIRMLPTGKVEVITGTSGHGQGHETAFSQIVADRLGVAFEDVELLHGDTRSRRGDWTPTVPDRWWWAGSPSSRRRTRWSRRPRSSRRICSKPTPTTSSSPAVASP